MGVPSPLAPAAPVAARTDSVRHGTPRSGGGAELPVPARDGDADKTRAAGGHPAGAGATLRGRSRRCRAPLTLSELAQGTHTVVARFATRTVERVIDVEPGARCRSSSPDPGDRGHRGARRSAGSIPLQVYRDGELVGSTATGSLRLPAGEHALEMRDDRLASTWSAPFASRRARPRRCRSRFRARHLGGRSAMGRGVAGRDARRDDPGGRLDGHHRPSPGSRASPRARRAHGHLLVTSTSPRPVDRSQND
jgi:hypothetical protein